jgi:uncharacterized protein
VRVGLVRRLVAGAFAAPTTLADALARLGFVQADPIRAPARAQDLILRHRVRGYRAGDLERRYPALGLDEAFVYAYGFVPPETHGLLHPRAGPEPEGLERDVLDFVRRAGPTHPAALLAAFGAGRETNYWGGQSRATTRALERLHYWGHLRVARRDAGVRVYAAADPLGTSLDAAERLRRLTLLVARLFGPLPATSLRGVLHLMRHALPGVDGRATVVKRLLDEGALERGDVDGVAYVWPAGATAERAAVGARVRLLAPFDPVVWDRRRVEHLWGWDYRFEAYTPAPKRRFGYYALPMLWRDRLVGWANVTRAPFDVALGFVDRRPRDAAFARALDAELERLETFLRP